MFIQTSQYIFIYHILNKGLSKTFVNTIPSKNFYVFLLDNLNDMTKDVCDGSFEQIHFQEINS